MGRDGWMLLRAYLPAGLWLGAALLATAVLAGLGDSPITASLFTTLRWVPIGMAGWAFLLFGSASYRLWQWEKGAAPACNRCGGPLGREWEGRSDRGGAFRQCLACAQNINHRYYE
jgi:hypothetical protein